MNEGVKLDGKKPRTDLVSPIALFALARVLTHGAKKYAERNWEKGMAWMRAIGAIIRHTLAYMLGETSDPETGESHMAHVMCEAMFLVHWEQTQKQYDDRPNYGLSPEQIKKIVSGIEEGLTGNKSESVVVPRVCAHCHVGGSLEPCRKTCGEPLCTAVYCKACGTRNAGY